jgi:hypothetical protein
MTTIELDLHRLIAQRLSDALRYARGHDAASLVFDAMNCQRALSAVDRIVWGELHVYEWRPALNLTDACREVCVRQLCQREDAMRAAMRTPVPSHLPHHQSQCI